MGRNSILPDLVGDPVVSVRPFVRRCVTWVGHNGPVVSAVIFDFYGTLAHFADTGAASYATVFAAHGYTPDPDLVDGYHAR